MAVDLGTLGGTLSIAAEGNDRGRVVGWSTNTGGETHAVLWHPDGDDEEEEEDDGE